MTLSTERPLRLFAMSVLLTILLSVTLTPVASKRSSGKETQEEKPPIDPEGFNLFGSGQDSDDESENERPNPELWRSSTLPDQFDEDDVEAWFKAAENDKWDELHAMFEEGFPIDYRRKGHTALHTAAKGKAIESTKFLVTHGADVGALQAQDHGTPLHLAAFSGEEKVVKLLLDHGADTDRLDKRRRTALYQAIVGGHEEVANLLLDRGASPIVENILVPHLYVAINKGRDPIARRLLNLGANVTELSPLYCSPLHAACAIGSADIVRELLVRGADEHVNLEDKRDLHRGERPIHLASIRGHAGAIRLLLRHGADVNAIEQEHKRSPLLLAAGHGHADAISMLCNNGADPSLRDDLGMTVLHLAVLSKASEAVRAAMNCEGVDVDARAGEDNLTPREYAVRIGLDYVVEAIDNPNPVVESSTDEDADDEDEINMDEEDDDDDDDDDDDYEDDYDFEDDIDEEDLDDDEYIEEYYVYYEEDDIANGDDAGTAASGHDEL